MTDRDLPWPAGTPCWADVGVADVGAAQAFYAAVLGWDWEPPTVVDRTGGYWNALVRGRRVAGLSPLTGAGQPQGWTLWFATGDAAATADRILAAGGSVAAAPTAVGDLGTMTLATDPSGAVFGTWQPGSHIGTSVANEAGALTWEDLRSTDPAAAQAFYRRVFGFETVPLSPDMADYVLFHPPGDPAPYGGMGGLFDLGGGSRWDVYFAVSDTDAATTAAEDHGGACVRPAHDTPYGRMAGLADPGGALFHVITPTPGQPQPDRPGG